MLTAGEHTRRQLAAFGAQYVGGTQRMAEARQVYRPVEEFVWDGTEQRVGS